MSGGTFTHCPKCQKLSIYGAVCTCGHRTDMPYRGDEEEGKGG